ncbi:MAG: CHAD domain-containing protein [Solirubrobacteraceae bacterium]
MISRSRRLILVTASSATGLAGLVLGRRLIRAHEPERAVKDRPPYRIQADEKVGPAVRRIAAAQLDLALGRLGDFAPMDEEAIHDARKALKRTRALLRLSRDLLGTETFRRENHNLRDAGLALSGVRDAQVLQETLIKLDLEVGDWSAAPGDTGGARGRRQAISAVSETRLRVTLWPLPQDGHLSALAPGYRRIYRQGRRGLARVRAEPSDPHWHELRKRAKDLWHASQLLKAAHPRRMGKMAKRAHRLSDLLGDDHDLVVLADHARRKLPAEDPRLDRLAAAITRRRSELQREALELAGHLYRRKPQKALHRLHLL